MDQINKEDTINRQAAIDAIDKYSVWVTYTQGDSQNDEAEFVENIIKQTKKAIQSMLREDLPSAQADIIRCRDCKHWDKTWTNEWSPDYHYCPMMDGERKSDFYCADAERQEE